jgi:hypothetical protein
MEMFNLKKLNEIEGKEQYVCHVEVSNRFAALKALDSEVDSFRTTNENFHLSVLHPVA